MRVVPAKAETIENPHFKPKNGEEKPEAKQTSEKTTSLRREIVNPHYRPEARLAGFKDEG